MTEELAKKIKDSSIFSELQEHIITCIYALNDIKGLEGKTTLEVGETVRARAMAVKALEIILSPFINTKEKSEPTEEQVNDKKKKFGL